VYIDDYISIRVQLVVSDSCMQLVVTKVMDIPVNRPAKT
jgi:hypothetical protein